MFNRQRAYKLLIQFVLADNRNNTNYSKHYFMHLKAKKRGKDKDLCCIGVTGPWKNRVV